MRQEKQCVVGKKCLPVSGCLRQIAPQLQLLSLHCSDSVSGILLAPT